MTVTEAGKNTATNRSKTPTIAGLKSFVLSCTSFPKSSLLNIVLNDRGYYKCSVKECRAKKMVQPTDKDPTVFEVTYVGEHSCSSTGQRRRSSRATPPAPGEGKSPGIEMEDSSNLEVTAWTGIIPDKRGRSIVEDDEASFRYLTTSPSQDREQVGNASMNTYLGPQSSTVLSFQEPLLWHDFDMDTNLSTGHKSVSMESDSP